METDSSRALGRVESACESLGESVKRILDNQEVARREVIDATGLLYKKLDQHSVTDEQSFALLRDGLGGLRDRIARFEPIVDTVESHGEALLQIEKWRSDSDAAITTIEAVRKRDALWAKSIAGAIGVAAGAGASKVWPGIWKWIGGLF